MGRLIPKDDDGFLINECARSCVVQPWLGGVEAATSAYQERFGDAVVSVYVRGSVPRGLAVIGVSDLDTFALISRSITEEDVSWQREREHRLAEAHPDCQEVELWARPLSRVMDPVKGTALRVTIKTQALCWWGRDLAPALPPVRPGPDTVFASRWLPPSIDKVILQLRGEPDPSERRAWCRWIMKQVVRTGLEMFMEEDGVFTRDLYPSYQVFVRHVPDREAPMRQALTWAIAPTDDVAQIIPFLEDFGRWIAHRGVDRWGPLTSQ